MDGSVHHLLLWRTIKWLQTELDLAVHVNAQYAKPGARRADVDVCVWP